MRAIEYHHSVCVCVLRIEMAHASEVAYAGMDGDMASVSLKFDWYFIFVFLHQLNIHECISGNAHIRS